MNNMTLMNSFFRTTISLVVFVLCAVSAIAQDKITVTGTVLDETDTPMIGAGVQEKGTGNGVITDIDGHFSIEVAPDATLTFNYISYKSFDMDVNGRAVINVKMEPDNNILDEVVVVGYNTVKRSDLTGSVSSVGAKSLEDFKTGSVMEALGGQIAGVQITQADGTPGSSFDIKIRGVGSVNGDSSPLYIVDGFEVDNLDFISNQDILSIDVLKDASASAIYGARAANGVVLVTTKSGREGRPQITYNGSASYREISRRMDLLSPYEFVALQVELNEERYANRYYREGVDDNGVPYRFQSIDDYLNGYTGIDWQEEAFRPTWSQNHDVSISGGSKDTKYTVSFSHFDENGIFINSGYQKNTARVKLNQKLFNWLTLDLSVNYANTVKDGIGTSGSSGSLNVLSSILRARPTGGVGMTDEDLLNNPFDPLELELNGGSPSANPIKQSEAVTQRRNAEQWVANAGLTFRLTKYLTFKTTAVFNKTYDRNDTFYGEESSQAYRTGAPYGQSQYTENFRWTNSNTLTYRQKIKKHNITAMLGHEVSFSGSEWILGQSQDFPFDDLGVDNLELGASPSRVASSKSNNMRLSFFAQGIYNWANRYHLTATIRADASTVFSQNHKWGYFPSFAAAWTISEEPFMKSSKNWLSNLKLRAGWGMVGNDRITNYLSMDLYTISKYGVGNALHTVLTPKQLANSDLKWEASMTTNVGLDLGFFDSRLNITVDGFIKDTKDLLLAQNLPYVTGFESQWQNTGKIRNKGLEININSVNFQNRNFFWSTDFNISFIKNTLVSLQADTQSMLSQTSFNSNFTSYDYIATVGGSLGDMYGYVFDGVYQTSDFNVGPDGSMTLKPGIPDISDLAGEEVRPGMVKYKDVTGDGIISTDDRTVIGNGYPDWYGGITNTFNIYNVDFSFMFQFNYGNEVYNATRLFATQSQDERSNQMAEVADRWTSTNASNSVPSATGYIRGHVYSRFIEDGSFLRLKNVTLGYTFPEKWTRKIYVSRLRIYASAQNLFCLTRYSGYDPEVNMRTSPLMPSFDWGAYPKSRTYLVGLELQF